MRLSLLFLLFFTTVSIWSADMAKPSGQKITLSGYIKDQRNGEALIGATVYIPELKTGTTSNMYGFYSVVVTKGNYNVVFSFLGYDSETKQIDLTESKTVDIALKEKTQQINEVVIKSDRPDKNVKSVEMSTVKMPIKLIREMPSFMGEVDILKSITLLPGIQSGGEGSSGLYVRGGGPDENLMVLDEAPVYNASHLLGFFSVFNSDVIKDIKVFKGGIPAEYGGKASSVIDVRMKDGNNRSFHGTGGIGSISSRLMLEGPIIKDKWSYVIAARRTYADVVGRAAGVRELKDNSLYFYDLNGKTNITLGKKDKLFVSAYTGDDKLKLGNSIYMRWGNITTTARWSHVFNNSMFLNTSFIFSNYDYNLGVPSGNKDNFDWTSRIRDYNIKQDYSYYLNPKNKLTFGFNAIKHKFNPGKITTGGATSYFQNIALTEYNALNTAVYLSNEQEVGSRITLQYGLRYSLFQQVGKGNVRTYLNPDAPLEAQVLDTLYYKTGDVIGNPYTHLEPRFSIKYSVNEASSLKASYNRMVQNLHMISNTNSPTPMDIWLPSNKYIKPLIVDQFAVGYFRNFADNMYETSIETYYKNMDNVLDYKDGADLFLRENIETQLLHGTGYSVGLELLLKKAEGRFNGWLSYTLSRTMRKIPGINQGKAYHSSYDRTHDVSLVLNYKLIKGLTLSSIWVYNTGNATSYPAAKYNIGQSQLLYYTERNSSRIPDYHRWDLSLNYDFRSNDRNRFKHTLNLSLYNVYSRRNAYSVTFRPNIDNPNVMEANRISIIGSIIPSLTYNFTF